MKKAMLLLWLLIFFQNVHVLGDNTSESQSINDAIKNISEQISAFATKPSSDVLTKLIIISKKLPNNSNSSTWSTDKQNKLKVLFQLLAVIDKIKDPSFESIMTNYSNGAKMPDKYKIFMNVPPPPNSGILPGEDPAQVKDPQLKKQYEDAIALNSSKIRDLTLQTDLYKSRNEILQYIHEFIWSWYKRDRGDQEKWQEIAKESLKDNPHLDEIILKLNTY